jgi:hypothetical protein
MMGEYLPFGGEKHIVRSDVRLWGGPPFFCTVVFRSRDELDALIASLTALRDGWDHPTGHIHLQDDELATSGDPTRFEVTFLTPTWADDEGEAETRASLIDGARAAIARLNP